MNDLQEKTLLQKAFDKLEEWKKHPKNVCGDPKDWPTYCAWIENFLNEMYMEEK